MTPFMQAVGDRLEGVGPAVPDTEPSEPESVAVATDAQVIIRSLAEQLISEANAVLGGDCPVLTLVDETGPGALAFTLGCGDRTARVQTVMSGQTAVAQLVIDGEADPTPRRLTSEGELQALVLSLIPAHH
jgi:hypothetical protein